MLDDQDERAWADIEHRLRADAMPRFLTFRVLSRRRDTPSRWLPYAMAVVVPLLLPAISVVEMRPVAACVGALLAATVVVLCSAWTGHSGTG